MSDSPPTYRPDYFAKIEPLCKVFLAEAGKLVGSRRYVPTLFNRYRPLQGKPSPFPDYAWGSPESQLDYSQLFAFGDHAGIDLHTIPEVDEFVDYARNDPRLSVYYATKLGDVDRWKQYAMYPVRELVDRYIRIHDSFDYRRESLIPIYEPIARGIFEQTLEIELMVPLLFLDADTDHFDISAGVSIERIGDDVHVARKYHEDHRGTVNAVVADYASCAFKLRGWSFPNTNFAYPLLFSLSDLLGEWWVPFDSLFAATRVVTGVETGYAQVVALPVGWAAGYTADLPPLSVEYRRAYPPKFDQQYWQRGSFPRIKDDELEHIRRMWPALFFTKEPRLKLATRRLNSCYLRHSAEDVLIDSMIGLETLLLADSRDELTHRLATRYAALAQLSQSASDPVSEYRKMKKLYHMRSTIVHGSDKQVSDETVQEVRDSLRIVLGLLAENPRYLECRKIDEDLILSRTARDLDVN